MEVVFSYEELLAVLLGCVWIALFLLRTELRKEMLLLSVIAMPLLPLAFVVGYADTEGVIQAFTQFGWNEILFAFSLAGIAAVSFHTAFGKRYERLPKVWIRERGKKEGEASFWIIRLLVLFLIFVWSVVIFSLLFHLPVATSIFVSGLILATYLVSHRHDLFADAIWSGLLTAAIVCVASTIAGYFVFVDTGTVPYLSGGFFLHVPIDLILWSFALGISVGPLYEYVRRINLR